MVHIPCEQTVHPLKAWVFIAGDTLLFHGNRSNQKLVRISGTQHFIGRSHGRCEPQIVDLVSGDFFVIASDGISDVRANGDERINESLRNLIDVDDLYGSTLAIIQECNRTVMDSRLKGADRYVLGFDNVSVLLVYPEDLSDCVHNETALLGGWEKALDR
jgi:serine/threonine protein phosphatase PrpC